MERSIKKLDDSHDEMSFRMAGTTERDHWMRSFPEPMPAGYVLRHAWEDLTLRVWVEKCSTPCTTLEQLATMNLDSPEAKALSDGIKAEKVAGLESELSALSDADLETRAAMEGVKVKDQKGKKLTKAVIIAAIVAKKGTPPRSE
jgi:hypothetical protein